MPAQQTQILVNPFDKEISPWYRLNSSEEKLITPEWQFKITDLKRFPQIRNLFSPNIKYKKI